MSEFRKTLNKLETKEWLKTVICGLGSVALGAKAINHATKFGQTKMAEQVYDKDLFKDEIEEYCLEET